jgi:DNA-binding LacI/PurR family transcriptional regulator
MAGARKALDEAGIPLPETRWYECGFAGEGAAAAVDRLLWNKEPITAIAASGVVIAMLALKALLQRGVRVPEEMSLIGFHDTPFAQYVTPGITTVRMPIEELARQAIVALIRQIEGVAPEPMMIVEPKPLLVVRQSVSQLEAAK